MKKVLVADETLVNLWPHRILYDLRKTAFKRFFSERGNVIKMSGKNRTDIKPGTNVQVVQKQDQRSGKLTQGIVKDILTNSSSHPHGIKVRLESGIVGRVKQIISDES